MNACIKQSTGDYQSARHDLVCENLSQLEHLDEDLLEKLRAQVLVSVSEYLTQFNELRDKIAKRRRKLIDFDSSRRVYELMLSQVNKKRLQQQQVNDSNAGVGSSGTGGRNFRSALALAAAAEPDGLQSATSQLVDEARLLKLREQYNYCKIMYETINSELHEELPMVYEKKMKNLLMTLQNYFSLEAQFHSNAGKLFATASDVIDELPMAIQTQHNQHHLHHHHHHNHQTHLSPAEGDNAANQHEEEHYGKTIASGSSGMGSSGGDSSLESSSSLNASQTGSPTGDDQQEVAADRDEEEEEDHVVMQQQQQLPVEQPEVGEEHDNEGEVDEDNFSQRNHGQQQQVEPAESIETDHQSGKFGLGDVHGSSQATVANVGHQMQHDDGEFFVSDAYEIIGCDNESIEYKQQQEPVEKSYEKQLIDDVPDNIEENSNKAEVEGDEFNLPKQNNNDDDNNCEDATIARPAEVQPEVQGCPVEQVEEEEEQEVVERKCLYKVKTSYKYLAEDVDELCFEADEIIQVIEFEEAQEQEEGWLMGIREVNGQRGLFPANFTRPV